MKIPKIKVIFDRKHQVQEKKLGAIEIRITFGRNQYYVSTGIRAKSMSSLYPEEVDTISIMQRNAQKYINRCIDKNIPISFENLKEKITLDKYHDDFMQFASDRMEHRVMKEQTRKHYKSMINMLERFGKIRSFSDLNCENIDLFDEWLHKRGLCQGTVYGYHKCLKAIINDAVAYGKITVNPYSRLDHKISRGDKVNIDYLTEEEFDKIRKINLPSLMLSRARDLFVFQTFTALSYSDLAKFDIKDYRHEDGKYYLDNGERTKTGERYVTQLLQPAIDILNKYDGKLPKLSNQKYNYCLKIIASAAGLNKDLHSHMARSTFATWALSEGVKIQNVSKMLGHTNVRQTMSRYAKILQKDVLDDFDKLDKDLEKKASM